MPKKLSYMKFLHLAQSLQDTSHFPYLDAIEERLINLCAGYWYHDINILVTDFAKMLPGISERTVHRRIRTLVEKDMLQLTQDPNDKRIKHIRATKQTEKYLSMMDTLMQKVNE